MIQDITSGVLAVIKFFLIQMFKALKYKEIKFFQIRKGDSSDKINEVKNLSQQDSKSSN